MDFSTLLRLLGGNRQTRESGHLDIERLKTTRHKTQKPGSCPVPWAKLTLDSTSTSDMQPLSTLKTGRLVMIEAHKLAKAIQHLQKLTLLTLWVCHSITDTEGGSWLTENSGGLSLVFLGALSSRGDVANYEGLPFINALEAIE